MTILDLLKQLGVELPEKQKPRECLNDPTVGMWEDGFNTSLDLMSKELSKEIEVDVEALQLILCEVFGCKLTKEDCFFKKCHNWGQCERIKEALASHHERFLKLK